LKPSKVSNSFSPKIPKNLRSSGILLSLIEKICRNPGIPR
jgi:hypothetical protein